MTTGAGHRPLVPAPTSGDDPAGTIGPALRAALNGSGPVLRFGPTPGGPAPGGPAPGGPAPGGPVVLGPDDDDPSDPTAAAITTSGSGGDPKTVLLPAAALLASAAATHDRLGGAGHWLLALPTDHVAGLQVLVRSLVAGTRPVALPAGARFTPAAFAAAAGRLPGRRRYTSLVPTQLTRLLTGTGADAAAGLDALRGFDAVLVGGAATAPGLLAAAAGAGVRVVVTYGMTETCGGCVYDGVPLDGVRVRLTPEGRVLLAGPVLARGYLGDDGLTGRSFVRDDEGRRWLRTDDAGDVDADGRLRVSGRLDTVIVTGGVNVAPGPVEAVLRRLPGVADAVVVGLPDPEWGQRVAAAVVLVPGARPPTLAEVRAAAAAQVSPPAAPRQLTVLERFPLRGPGKPDRTAVAAELTARPPLEGI